MNEDSTPNSTNDIDNRGASLLLQNELHTAWKYATRAVNVCESIGLPDTRIAIADIVVQISQQLEFVETQLQSERISCRHTKGTDDAPST